MLLRLRLSFARTFAVMAGCGLATFTAQPNASADVPLIRAGQPAATLVVPDRASAIEKFAAEELQAHLQLASGATFAIVTESARPKEGACVFIGNTRQIQTLGIDTAALPANGFVLRTQDGHLFLAGQDQQIRSDTGNRGEPAGLTLDNNLSRIGTMLAVYAFLDTQLGVRWLWPGEAGTFVPKRADLILPALDRTDTPNYLFKRWRVPRHMMEEAGWSSVQARNTFLTAQSQWLRRHGYLQQFEASSVGTHAFGRYWRDHGEDQPEMFNLLPNGKREPLPGNPIGNRITMCVSEPALWRQIVADWQDYRSPTGPWIRAGENDTPGLCTCERCRAWDAPDPGFETADYWGKGQIPHVNQRFRWDWSETPSLSDRYARFYLALLEEARKVDPQAQVTGYAYANYTKGPKNVRLDPAIIISLIPATYSGISSSTYFPYTAEKSAEFRQQWDGWHQTGARMVLRPNSTLTGHNFPIHYAHPMGEDIAHAVRSGVIGTDFDSLRGSFGTQAPTLYVIARIQERPDQSIDDLLEEFYAAFGDAAPAVRAYFEHWETFSSQVTQAQMREAFQRSGATRPFMHWFLVAPYLFTEPVMAQGRALLDAAIATQVADTAVRDRLTFLDLGLRDTEKVLALTLAYRQHQKETTDATLDAYVQAMQDLADHRQRAEGWHIGNFGTLNREERHIFDWSLLETHQQSTGRLPLQWQFQWDPEETGQAQGWFAENLPTDDWTTITFGAWQQQPAGRAWRQLHNEEYHGLAWYRTPLDIPDDLPTGHRAVLHFGAVDEAATVWVNGQQVLDRPFDARVNPNAWREPFTIDITSVIRPGASNQLTVRVESRGGLGGITRPVSLRIEPAAAEE